MALNYSSGQMTAWPVEECLPVSNPSIHVPRKLGSKGSFPKYLSPEKSLIHFRHLLRGNGSCISLLRMSKHFPLHFP